MRALRGASAEPVTKRRGVGSAGTKPRCSHAGIFHLAAPGGTTRLWERTVRRRAGLEPLGPVVPLTPCRLLDIRNCCSIAGTGVTLRLAANAGMAGTEAGWWGTSRRWSPSWDVHIRVATSADIENVLALWRAEGALPSATDDQVSVRRTVEKGNLLVALEEHGAIVASLIAAFDGWRGNLYRLVVAGECRRRGVARALVAAGEARLTRQGCRRITALVADSEPDVAAFWRAVGYERDDRIARYVKTVASADVEDPGATAEPGRHERGNGR